MSADVAPRRGLGLWKSKHDDLEGGLTFIQVGEPKRTRTLGIARVDGDLDSGCSRCNIASSPLFRVAPQEDAVGGRYRQTEPVADLWSRFEPEWVGIRVFFVPVIRLMYPFSLRSP